MRTIIYARFSPRPETDAAKCESCEVQQAYCEQYAHAKGWHVGGAYLDRAASGADEFRDELWAAIASLRRTDVLLVYRRDRLARNVYLSEQINRAVAARGARIEAVSGDVSGDGPEQVMVRQVLSAIAEYERRLISSRTSFFMRAHQKTGRRMGRFAPYGCAVDPADPARLVPVPREQEAVALVKSLQKEGRRICEIVRRLNAEMPDAVRGKKWVSKTVIKIMARE